MGLDPAAIAAAWNVESGPWPFQRGRPVIRFECHKFWEHWGSSHPEVFDAHFRFGGHGGMAGASWANHAMRLEASQPWNSFHGSQQGEYAAFALAIKLAGHEPACLSTSFGGPQILGSNHAKLGYESAAALYRAFARSLRAQVLGFLDFCQSESLLQALSIHDWRQFARIYNGPGKPDTYAEQLNDAYRLASAIIAENPHRLAEEVNALRFDHGSFSAFVQTLGLKHFSASEFLFRGRRHSMVGDSAYGLNHFPPKSLWPNIKEAARAVDAFRAEIGKPVVMVGLFRSPAYNAAIGGAEDSQHLRFAAIDLEARDGRDVAHWAQVMRSMRARGVFTGAVGLREGALHVDGRLENIDL
jgi:hypothetical protein